MSKKISKPTFRVTFSGDVKRLGKRHVLFKDIDLGVEVNVSDEVRATMIRQAEDSRTYAMTDKLVDAFIQKLTSPSMLSRDLNEALQDQGNVNGKMTLILELLQKRVDEIESRLDDMEELAMSRHPSQRPVSVDHQSEAVELLRAKLMKVDEEE